MKFYVYMHTRVSDGRVFYIGKGHGDRAHSARGRNKHWRSIVTKHGFRSVILCDQLTEREAFDLEITLIAACGRANLANKTNGGDGPAGMIATPLTRLKMSIAQTGKKHTIETKEKIAKAHIGMRYGEETRIKLSLFRTGKTLSTEHRKILSEGLKGNKRARDQTRRIFYHPSLGEFIGDVREFQLMTGEHPTKLIKGRKAHIKRWVYLGISID